MAVILAFHGTIASERQPRVNAAAALTTSLRLEVARPMATNNCTRVAERTCALCGDPFVPRTSKGAWRQKYCGVKCRRKVANRSADDRLGERHRTCEACGSAFKYFIARGVNRRFCSDPSCRATRMRTLAGGKPMCVTEGCQNKREYSSGLCNSCYIRLRRTGTLERRTFLYRSQLSTGYIVLATRDHPLSVNGKLFEHRKVLYAAIGPGPHACHWCGVAVDWILGRCAKGALVPDHLDGNKANNDLANLVPSCNPCNSRRGMLMLWVTKHKDDPILWQMYESARAKGVV